MTEGETRQDVRTVEQIVDGMSLFDDDLMSMVFDGNTGKYYNRHNPDIGIMSKCRKNRRERICAGPDSTAA